MSELRPMELDVLEDLLEGLEQEMPGVEGLEDPEARRLVSERLADYRAILQASRDALPLEEVPTGLLDGVLEEARTSTSAPSADRSRSLWARLRGTFVIPGLALATAAALVMVLVRPGEGEPDEAPTLVAAKDPVRGEPEPVAANEGAPEEDALAGERIAEASLEQRVGGEEARGRGALGAAPVPTQAPVEESEAKADPFTDEAARDTAVGGMKREKQSKPTASSSSAPSKTAPRSTPVLRPDEPKALPKASTKSGSAEQPGGASAGGSWARLEQADAQRRAGNCTHARASYDAVLKTAEANERTLRARAHVGLGLCDVQAGKQTAAEAHFAKARAADPSVRELIDAELGR